MRLNDYYKDRGIIKYQGFFLSEHTNSLQKDFSQENKVNEGKEQMTPDEISDVLALAILKELPVAIQLNYTIGDGLGFPDDLVGKVKGYDEERLLIAEEFIYFSFIRNVEFISMEKWYKC